MQIQHNGVKVNDFANSYFSYFPLIVDIYSGSTTV